MGTQGGLIYCLVFFWEADSITNVKFGVHLCLAGRGTTMELFDALGFSVLVLD